MKNLKRILILVLSFIFIVALVACSSSQQSKSSTGSAVAPQAAGDGMGSISKDKANSSESVSLEELGGHKIIQNANISLETREFDKDYAYIIQRITGSGGYISASNLQGRKPENYDDTGRSLSLTARVPEDKLEAFLADVEGSATLISSNRGSQDITSDYFDVDSRVNVLKIQLQKLEEMLVKAQNVADMITIETEISKVQTELDQLTTQLKRWDSLISYSTVQITLRELPPAVLSGSKDSIWIRMGEGFIRTLNGVGVFFEDLAVFLIAALPALVVIGLLVLLIIWIVRKSSKHNKQKIQKLQEKFGQDTENKPE